MHELANIMEYGENKNKIYNFMHLLKVDRINDVQCNLFLEKK